MGLEQLSNPIVQTNELTVFVMLVVLLMSAAVL